jgi:hypothetical protein
MFPNVLDKQSSRPNSRDGDEGGYKVSDLPNHRVYYYHGSVMSLGLWEFNNEVYTDGVPRGVRDRKWMEFKFANWFVSLGFGADT